MFIKNWRIGGSWDWANCPEYLVLCPFDDFSILLTIYLSILSVTFLVFFFSKMLPTKVLLLLNKVDFWIISHFWLFTDESKILMWSREQKMNRKIFRINDTNGRTSSLCHLCRLVSVPVTLQPHFYSNKICISYSLSWLHKCNPFQCVFVQFLVLFFLGHFVLNMWRRCTLFTFLSLIIFILIRFQELVTTWILW